MVSSLVGLRIPLVLYGRLDVAIQCLLVCTVLGCELAPYPLKPPRFEGKSFAVLEFLLMSLHGAFFSLNTTTLNAIQSGTMTSRMKASRRSLNVMNWSGGKIVSRYQVLAQ